MNDKDFVSLEVAKLLKEKGFDEECVAYYAGDKLAYICANTRGADVKMIENMSVIYKDCAVLAPTLSQAQKWLVEKHQIYVSVNMYGDSVDVEGKKIEEWNYWGFEVYYTTSLYHICESHEEYDSYEEALNDGISKALLSI